MPRARNSARDAVCGSGGLGHVKGLNAEMHARMYSCALQISGIDIDALLLLIWKNAYSRRRVATWCIHRHKPRGMSNMG